MRSSPIQRTGQKGWRHDEGLDLHVFETYDALDVLDPWGPRKVHLLLPRQEAAGPMPLVVFLDGDTTFWPGGVAHATWDVARTVDRLRAAGSIRPMVVAAIHPVRRDEEYTHVDWRGGRAPWGGLDRFADWLATHWLPWALASIPGLSAKPSDRAIVGSSHGGLAAFRIATSHARAFGTAGCLSPSFFSGLDDLDLGEAPSALIDSDLLRRAAPTLDGPERPRLWLDWGLRRDGGPHNAMVERLATLRGEEMATLLETRFGYPVNRIGPSTAGPRNAEAVVCVDPLGGHDERAWSHRAGLFLETFFAP